MERFTLDEFRDYYQEVFSKVEVNLSNLEGFFGYVYPKLPLFPKGNFIKIKSKDEYNKWDDENIIICEKRWLKADAKQIIVDVENLMGDSWVFNNEHEDGRPLPERMARLFLAKKPEDIPALFATRISENKYYTNDGNHRIYAAYLRGEKVHILVEGEFTDCDLTNK